MIRIDRYWYDDNWLSRLLLPVSWLFCFLVGARRWLYRAGLIRSYDIGVPVVVVGNISVGGAGKTPLVLWLAAFLEGKGYKPGIASRGHGSSTRNEVRLVAPDGDAERFGDEPLLLAKRSGLPVAVCRDRVAAGRYLARELDCDIVVTDDGLQHYRLRRNLEIAVVDEKRGHGNGRCLPAGPLRESKERLKSVDLAVVNGEHGRFAMTLQGERAVNLASGEERPLTAFAGRPFHAVAGIGHPDRFFDDLRARGMSFEAHAYPDHHRYSPADLNFGDDKPILMTEKDAVKCDVFASPRHWYLPVDTHVAGSFGEAVLSKLGGE